MITAWFLDMKKIYISCTL